VLSVLSVPIAPRARRARVRRGRRHPVAVLVVATALAAVGACGSASRRNPPPAPGASGTTEPQPLGVVPVTAADAGGTIRVVRGQTVAVTLHSGELWAAPSSSDPTVLAVDRAEVDQTTGDARATFTAVGTGTAVVRSDRRCLPSPGIACTQSIVAWQVTVTVV